MQEMLSFLSAQRKEPHAVIIDDISRLARGLMAHFELGVKIGDSGCVLVSPSIEFGEDSDSQLVENLLASVSQHQRQKNGEQTINRMRARMQSGYWVFQAPVGYRYEREGGQGKRLVRDEPNASILQEAFEGYASGRFATQVEVKRFLERPPSGMRHKTHSRASATASRPRAASWKRNARRWPPRSSSLRPSSTQCRQSGNPSRQP
jgi:site-specific DNA recombinase